MKRAARAILALFLLLAAACTLQPPSAERSAESSAQPAEKRSPLSGLEFEPLEFAIPEVERLQLPNGIHVYLKEDHELPLVSITAMAEAGSISVPAAKTGLDGLLAALLRTGGAGERTPMEVDQTLEMMAANLSVNTDTYATTFDLSLQAEELEAGMAILADMIRRPRFDPERLELARKQAIEGIRRQNDQPSAIASRALKRAIYDGHPLGRTPTEETVAAVDRADLLHFHQKFFYPNNLWLAISGDFDRQQLLALLERLFGDWATGDVARQDIPPVPENPEPMVLVGTKDVPQTTILIGELGIEKSSPDLHAVRVMNFILGGGGFNSRLMREIRSNRGLAYSAYSYFQVGRRLPGPFVAGTETKSGSTLEAVNLIREILARMQREPVAPHELELAKESIINSFIFGFTETHDVVTQQLRLDFYEYPEDYLQTYRDKVAAVTAEDIHRAAQKHLNPARHKIVLVGDTSAFDGAPESLGPPVKQVEKTGEFK